MFLVIEIFIEMLDFFCFLGIEILLEMLEIFLFFSYRNIRNVIEMLEILEMLVLARWIRLISNCYRNVIEMVVFSFL